MKYFQHAALAAAIVLSAASLPAMAQDVNAGKQVYAQCAACHAVTAANGVGPGLLGIVGRKSAASPGFRYSPALKRANLTWDEKNLDAYITDPQKAVPGNLMPFSGIADAKQRADLIAYLNTVK
ncbi:cytochrome c2 [Herbaspirillum sp. CF444]|uniref:c-type cytochrome n=1 Tax=Herbaspirillum sp. CF444 TaxID=1144319 RepID=UPI0002723388|nr:cytochrome c family protein [Herbaspirillum sp. CF444]EJL92127.1 cytochrome c2 [Herbaspirillum sp. CF444]